MINSISKSPNEAVISTVEPRKRPAEHENIVVPFDRAQRNQKMLLNKNKIETLRVKRQNLVQDINIINREMLMLRNQNQMLEGVNRSKFLSQDIVGKLVDLVVL